VAAFWAALPAGGAWTHAAPEPPSPFAVEASVDARRIGIQDTVEYQIEVRGSGFSQVEPPDLRNLAGWEVLQGPSRVQRQTVINGEFSSAIQYHWTLGPRKVGPSSIPAATVLVDGKSHRTASISLEVVEGSQATRVPSVDRFGRRQATEGEVRLVAEVDRDRVYVGEQVTFTLRLLTQLRIRGMNYQTRADFEGFWVEKEYDYIDDPPGRITGKQVNVGGESFNEYLLARVALFPTASGAFEIEPVNLQMQVRADRSDAFGSFFFDRDRAIYRRSSPLSVEVRPLPSEGRPGTFTGAVGTYRLEVSTDRTESVVNDAVGLQVRVSGQGQIRTVGEPSLPPLSDFRAFDPTVEETQRFESGRFTGSRSWDYVLVPLAPGSQSIPPVVFSYFDPASGGYQTLRSDPAVLRIGRGDNPEIPASAGFHRQDVTRLREDIAFIKLPSGPLLDRSAPFYRSGAYLALLVLPALLNLALVTWKFRSDRLQADVGRRRLRGGGRTFRRALTAAERLGPSEGVPAFCAAVHRALSGLIADRHNLAAAGLTQERIREVLLEGGADDALVREVENLLVDCDAARFAGSGADEATMRELSSRATDIGRRLEQAR
jgi:BatD DUF11 like domain